MRKKTKVLAKRKRKAKTRLDESRFLVKPFNASRGLLGKYVSNHQMGKCA